LRDNEVLQRVGTRDRSRLKGFFKIPGTDTIMKVGGYAKVDFIYDANPIGTFDYFVTSAIPTSGPDTTRGSQFTVQAKQTRMNVDIRRDTEAGPARVYVEADWFGNASSNFDPGSYQLQLHRSGSQQRGRRLQLQRVHGQRRAARHARLRRPGRGAVPVARGSPIHVEGRQEHESCAVGRSTEFAGHCADRRRQVDLPDVTLGAIRS
jgi:hypothetical protein